MKTVAIRQYGEIDNIIEDISSMLFKIKEDTMFDINGYKYLASIKKKRPKEVRLNFVIDETENSLSVSAFPKAIITKDKTVIF